MGDIKAYSFLPYSGGDSQAWFDAQVTDSSGHISFIKPESEFADAQLAFCQVQHATGKYFAVVTAVGSTVEVDVYDDTGALAPASIQVNIFVIT